MPVERKWQKPKISNSYSAVIIDNKKNTRIQEFKNSRSGIFLNKNPSDFQPPPLEIRGGVK